MAELTKQALRVENNTEFPNNNNGQITPSRLRGFNEDMIDSTVNQAQYTADSASFNTRINNVTGSATNTGSLLLTASFDNGTRNLTFTKGDASTFAVNIPDVSGSTINTGSFATTGSNTFVGNQTITGSLTISGSSEFELTIQGRGLITGPTASVGTSYTPQLLISGSDFNNRIGRSTAIITKDGRGFGSGVSYGRFDAYQDINSQAIINIGVFDEPNFVTDVELLVQVDTGSGIQFQDVRNDTYAYSTWMSIAPNTGNNPDVIFRRNVDISGSLDIQNTLTASLQQGYVWVGDAAGRTTTVATSSFGGGGATFPFTGDAVITGSLTISSSAAVDLTVIGGVVVTGSTSITGALSITPISLPNTVPAGGTERFTIPVLSGSNNVFARDIDNALYWSPAFNQLAVSASGTGNTGMTPGGMSVNSSTTGSSVLTATRIASNFGAGRNIAIAGDAAGTALTGLTGITSPSIILQSGSAGLPSYYAPIQFESSQSFTDGRVTVTRPLDVRGNTTITGSVFISSSGGLGLSNTDGANVQYFGNSFGSNIGVYKVSDATEIGLALDGAAWTTNWGNGPIIYVNNTPGDTYEGVFGFQNKTNYTDGRVTVLKPLDVRGNTTITGSLTISSSAATDLAVIGNSVFTGNTTITGSTPSLTIGGTAGNTILFPDSLSITSSFYRNLQGPRLIEISKKGYDYPPFLAGYTAQSSSVLVTYTDNLSATASYNVGVFDNAFSQDVELYLETTTTNGVQFKDIDGNSGVPQTFLRIAPNYGTNPPLEFKRGMQITGSLSIQSGSALPVSTGSAILTWNASTGRVTQAPFSSILSASVSSGEFWSTTTQSGSAGVSGSVTFNNSGSFYNTSVVNGTQLQVANGGVYNIQFSAQIETSAGADTLWIWFKKNGNNIGASASKAVLANNTAQIMTVNILDEAVANDYYEIAYQNLNGNATILSEAASGNIPAIPSVIATIFQIR